MLWLSFVICVFLAILVLYLPGFFLLKSFKFSHITSFAAAPAITVPSYAIICILLSILGISATGKLVFGSLLAISLLCFVVLTVSKKNKLSPSVDSPNTNKKYWLILLLYLATGILIGTFFFVRSLDTPVSFFQDFDNVFHLNLVQSFLTSGDWSSLHASVYTASEFYANTTPRTSWTSFYPAAWHCLNAILASLLTTEGSIVIAQNALLFVFSFFVFPLAVFILLKRIFNGNTKLLLCGTVLSVGFAVFPWGMLVWGPIYPNLAAFCLVPLTASLYIHIFEEKLTRKRYLLHISLIIFSAIGYILIQPNAVFALVVFLAPFTVYKVFKLSQRSFSNQKALFFSFLFGVFAFIAWAICYKLPFFQGTVTFTWAAYLDTSEATLNAITQAMSCVPAPQILLAILVTIGIIYSIQNRQYLWLSVVYLFCLLMFVATSSTEGTLKHFLTGFWYTDPNRIGSLSVFAGIPLSCLGLLLLLSAIEKLYLAATNALQGNSLNKKLLGLTNYVIIALLIFFPFYPKENSFYGATAFGNIQNKLIDINNQTKVDLLDESERNFLLKVKNIVGTEDLIINSPGDGSLFAYSLLDLNTYYRAVSNFPNTTSYSGAGETEASYHIRTSLKTISDNQSVKNAIGSTGAKYVLILGSENREVRTYNSMSYDSSDWVGIDSITADTPGFTLILEEDGMKLFSINE